MRPTASQALNLEWIKKNTDSNDFISDHLQNMVDFKIQNKFQEATLTMICNRQLSTQMQSELATSFLLLDGDYDGQINKNEFKMGFNKHIQDPFGADEGINAIKDDSSLVFDRCDLSSNGVITYTNFLVAASKKSEILTEKNLQECFKTFDIFAKQFITYDDLERFYGKGDNQIWNKILIEAVEYYHKI